MDQLIESGLKEYDFILLDTPPIALVTDAFVMTKYADHILYLTRQNYTPRQSVTNVDELFRSGKLANISILLNDISLQVHCDSFQRRELLNPE